MTSLNVGLRLKKKKYNHSSWHNDTFKDSRKKGATITFELVEHGPQLCNVGRKGDICVKDNDPLQVGRKSLGQDKLHQTVNARVVFVGDPGYFRLDQAGTRSRKKERGGKKESLHSFFA